MSNLSRFTGLKGDDNTYRKLSGDFQQPAFNANIAIKTKQNSYLTIVQPAQLTGAVTMSINTDSGADDVAPFVGDEVEFLLQSDATSRIVTFGTGFAPNGTLTVTTGKYGYIKFKFNGTVWQETSRTVTA